MSILAKAIEMTGHVDDRHHITLAEPLPEMRTGRVRLIVLYEEDDGISEADWTKAAAQNPAFGFLQDKAEDIYNLCDGHAFHA